MEPALPGPRKEQTMLDIVYALAAYAVIITVGAMVAKRVLS